MNEVKLIALSALKKNLHRHRHLRLETPFVLEFHLEYNDKTHGYLYTISGCIAQLLPNQNHNSIEHLNFGTQNPVCEIR